MRGKGVHSTWGWRTPQSCAEVKIGGCIHRHCPPELRSASPSPMRSHGESPRAVCERRISRAPSTARAHADGSSARRRYPCCWQPSRRTRSCAARRPRACGVCPWPRSRKRRPGRDRESACPRRRPEFAGWVFSVIDSRWKVAMWSDAGVWPCCRLRGRGWTCLVSCVCRGSSPSRMRSSVPGIRSSRRRNSRVITNDSRVGAGRGCSNARSSWQMVVPNPRASPWCG
ncbi:MAG: hypothetical protein K0R99_3710 [Microbacterium sp.]|nr:hypothetical protein [Microbacterium sp.]